MRPISNQEKIICFPHKPSQEGGPGTFQTNFENYLNKKSYKVIYQGSKLKPNLILVVAGTKKILWLIFMKFSGVKIIHRLDGMNWKYEYEEVPFKARFKQIFQNYLMSFIRKYLANKVVYQSNFIERWWNDRFGLIKNSSVIVNGSTFYDGTKIVHDKEMGICLTCIEGTIQNDLVTSKILESLDRDLHKIKGVDSIEIFGNYSNFEGISNLKNISFNGVLPRNKMKQTLNAKKRIFFLLELNPPCPNSMIEALCLGIPCIGFKSGSFEELLLDAGTSIPYDGDVWKLEIPNLDDMVEQISSISENYEVFSDKALQIAHKYDAEIMSNKYLKLIQELL